ncbi:MAG TPA: urease subunit gamma [Candidatus Limnocylindrales bacterium]|nr:urease subunit gamma [Candidatus Limnocylindrales bacterium]
MRLTAWETDRLLIFSAAELARRHRAAGLALNHPEAVALIADAMLEAARAGGSMADVEAAGHGAVAPGDVMDGVADLLDEIRIEVLMGDGTRLVVLVDPLGTGAADRDGPGSAAPGPGRPASASPDRERRTITVRSTSRRAIRVSSHYPFERVNPRLEFDRTAAAGFRLDLPAGAFERWAPGESRTVTLVRYRGSRGDSDAGR